MKINLDKCKCLLFVILLVFTGNSLKSQWLITPAYVKVKSAGGNFEGLGSGVSLTSLFSNKFIGIGINCQVMGQEYLAVEGGYFKMMPILALGYYGEKSGFYVGGGYGFFDANNGGEDVKYISSSDLTGKILGWTLMAHFCFNQKTAFEYNYDQDLKGYFRVHKFSFIIFYALSLNASYLEGPGIKGFYIYPGITIHLHGLD